MGHADPISLTLTLTHLPRLHPYPTCLLTMNILRRLLPKVHMVCDHRVRVTLEVETALSQGVTFVCSKPSVVFDDNPTMSPSLRTGFADPPTTYHMGCNKPQRLCFPETIQNLPLRSLTSLPQPSSCSEVYRKIQHQRPQAKKHFPPTRVMSAGSMSSAGTGVSRWSAKQPLLPRGAWNRRTDGGQNTPRLSGSPCTTESSGRLVLPTGTPAPVRRTAGHPSR